MKISELIAQLTKLQDAHGDVRVVAVDDTNTDTSTDLGVIMFCEAEFATCGEDCVLVYHNE